MATIVDDILEIATYIGANFVSHVVESITTLKTFQATDFPQDTTKAILYVYCSVDIGDGDPTITFGKPGFEAALPAPSEIFAITDYLSPRPITEESRSYRYDVTSTVDSPGLYNISGSALTLGNIYFGATLLIVYEYTNDTGPVTIPLARTRTIKENAGALKIAGI